MVQFIMDLIVSSREDLKTIPYETGVYCFKVDDIPIYVGASRKLRERLGRFFGKYEGHSCILYDFMSQLKHNNIKTIGIKFCNISELNNLEQKIIKDLKPSHNDKFALSYHYNSRLK